MLLDVAYLTAQEIRNHPRWLLARNQYMRLLVETHMAPPALKRMMHDVARQILFGTILNIHASQEEARETWATVSKVRDTFLPFGMASPRRFDEMLARLRSMGFIEVKPAPQDKRLRLVVPTQRMIEVDFDWQAAHLSPLATLLPDSTDYDPAFARDPVYRVANRLAGSHSYEVARDVLDPIQNPLLAFATYQDALNIIFLYLAEAVERGTVDQISLSYDAVSERLSTSRTHIRNLMQELESQGMVKRHGRGGEEIELTPLLWTNAEKFLSEAMSANDRAWQIGRAIVAGQK